MAAQAPEELAWRRVRRAIDGLAPRVLSFAERVYGDDVFEEAWEEFAAADEAILDQDWRDSLHGVVFIPWMLHQWSPDPLGTCVEDEALHGVEPMRAYLERHGARLDPAARRYAEACLRASFSFHQILRCDRGRGFRAKDMLTGEEREVLETAASQSLSPGDVLFAVLVLCDGIVTMDIAAPMAIEPGRTLPIIDFRTRLMKRGAPPDLKEFDVEIRDLYFAIMEPIVNPALPELRNTDGDELSLQQVVFEIDSPQEAFDALKHLAIGCTEEELLAGAARDAEGRLVQLEFPWNKQGNAVHTQWDSTVLGRIRIQGKRLRVDVNSDRRAERIKAIIVDALGERARYTATRFESVEHGLRERASGSHAARGAVESEELSNDPEVRNQLASILEAHYENWVNEKIPALDGKTPMQAVKARVGREKVAALLDQFERDGARMTPPLDESITQRLRERLGLLEKRSERTW